MQLRWVGKGRWGGGMGEGVKLLGWQGGGKGDGLKLSVFLLSTRQCLWKMIITPLMNTAQHVLSHQWYVRLI